MLFKDAKGRILLPEEVDRLTPWEIEERMLHVLDDEEWNI